MRRIELQAPLGVGSGHRAHDQRLLEKRFAVQETGVQSNLWHIRLFSNVQKSIDKHTHVPVWMDDGGISLKNLDPKAALTTAQVVQALNPYVSQIDLQVLQKHMAPA